MNMNDEKMHSAGARGEVKRRLLLILVLTAIADFLVFKQISGLNLFLVHQFTTIAIFLGIADRSGFKRLVAPWLFCLICGLPLLEAPTIFALGISFVGLAAFCAACVPGAATKFYAFDIIGFVRATPTGFYADIVGYLSVPYRFLDGLLRFEKIKSWLLPLFIGLVFLALFGVANPIIQNAIFSLRLDWLSSYLDISRWLFWLFSLTIVAVFLVRRGRLRDRQTWINQMARLSGVESGFWI